MATMFAALGFQSTPLQCGPPLPDSNCPQVDHGTTERKGVTIHTFLPLGVCSEQALGWPHLQEGTEVRVFWPKYDEWYNGHIDKRSVERRQGSEWVVVHVHYPESDTWAAHRLPLAGRWKIESINSVRAIAPLCMGSASNQTPLPAVARLALCDYERQRAEAIRRNQLVLNQLGLHRGGLESTSCSAGQALTTGVDGVALSPEKKRIHLRLQRMKAESSGYYNRLVRDGWEVEGDDFVGRQIRKEFDGEWYVGMVTHWHPRSCWWHVEYGDGDRETVHGIDELGAMLIP